MEALNKNKEEIEKIDKEIKDLYYDSKGCIFNDKDINEWKSPNYLILKNRLQERIKTSILWCEDEIEKFEHIFGWLAVCNKNQDILRVADIIKKNIKALQTHLTWLKTKDKKL